MRGTVEWYLMEDGAQEDDQANHGSCVLSKIAGPQLGIAKKVDVVIIKLNAADGADTADNTWKAFVTVLLHVIKYNRQGNAVINYSRNCMKSSL